MTSLPPKPVLAAPMPTIQTSRPSDEHPDRQQILHGHDARPAPPLFSGSSALAGTDLDDDFDDIQNSIAQHMAAGASSSSLAPPHHTATRRSPSPRATSPAVGTIGGHRAGTGNSVPPAHLDRQPSDESLTFQSIRSASPLSLDSSPVPPSFHAFRSISPSFASAMSHVSAGGQDNNGRQQHQQQQQQPPSLYQVMGEQHHPQRFNTASPASSDRPSSRLDISRLQQRQAKQQQQRQDSGSNSSASTFAQHFAQHRGTPTLNFPGQDSQQHANIHPHLVQPRPEMPMRTFSESSSAVGILSPAADQVSPAPMDPTLIASLGAMGVKPDGYPFPVPQQQQQQQQQPMHGGMTSVDRSGHNSSRQSFRSAVAHQGNSRVNSPMDPSRMRFPPQQHHGRPQQHHQQHQQHQHQHQQHQQALGPPPEQRLINVEAALEELNKGLTSVARSVGWLIEREQERERTGSNNSNGSRTASVAGSGTISAAGTLGAAPSEAASQPQSEELRMLGQQVSVLSNSVQQLMIAQQAQQQQSRQGRGPAQQQSQFLPNGQQYAPPTLGAFPSVHDGMRPISPNFAPPHANSITSPLLPPTVDARGTSPRGGGSLGPNSRQAWTGSPRPDSRQGNDSSRRWSHLPPPGSGSTDPNSRRESLAAGGKAGETQSGAMPAPESNVTVTKWEHLNLQPDLLRSVLKYGLGPPNKIQQRALPFLLRGSDIIAQAPPTQERIASYVIPALQSVLNTLRSGTQAQESAGPFVLMISTTVDQATQAQRMALGLGSSLGVRVHIAAAASVDAMTEAQNIIQHRPHIVVGTPAKMSEVITNLTNLQGVAVDLADVRMVVLDEVDQMIARNLSDHVGTLLRVLPPLRDLQPSPSVSPGLPQSSGPGGNFNPFDGSTTPTRGERQTAIFSNTVPQDVLNFAQSIHLRESVRVLVRREGTSVTQHPAPGSVSGGSVPPANGNGSGVARSGNGVPSNALGAIPTYNLSRQSVSPSGDATLQLLKGLRQYYLYIAVSDARPIPTSSGFSSTGGEMKLDVIADLLEDMEFSQVVLYTGSSGALEAVTYKLASRGIEALALHRDMALHTRQQVLSKFRSPISAFAHTNKPTRTPRKALIAYDVALNPREVHQIPLIIFYDLPRSLEEYKEKLSCGAAAAGGMSRPSVCINVVTGSGGPRGDIEMLKVLESGLGCKMAELPIDAKGILNE